MEKAFVGYCRAGYCRVGVFICDWDNKVLPRLKKVDGSKIWKKMLARFEAR